MDELTPPKSATKQEIDSWTSVIDRRKAAWEKWDETTLRGVILGMNHHEKFPPSLRNDRKKQLEWILTKNVYRALNSKISPDKRTICLQNCKEMIGQLKIIEARVNEKLRVERGSRMNRPDPTNGQIGHQSSSGGHNAGSPSLPSNSHPNPQQTAAAPLHHKQPPNPILNGVSHQSKSVSSAEQARQAEAAVLGSRKETTTAPREASLPNSSTQAPDPNTNGLHRLSSTNKPLHQQSTQESRNSHPTENTPRPTQQNRTHPPSVAKPANAESSQFHQSTPSSQDGRRPPAPDGQMGAALLSASGGRETARSLPTRQVLTQQQLPLHKRVDASSKPPDFITAAPPPVYVPNFKVTDKGSYRNYRCWLPPDPNNAYTNAHLPKKGRQTPINVLYDQPSPTADEINKMIRRLHTWDPYWEILEVVSMAWTQPVKGVSHCEESAKPKRACHGEIRISAEKLSQISGWKQIRSASEKYGEGDTKVIFRMLPKKLAKTKAGHKARADYHLWPAGTFLLIDGTPRFLQQRTHDKIKWSGMCEALDVTQYLERNASTSKYSLTTYDGEAYMACVAVCRYRSPTHIYRTVMSSIRKLSEVEGAELARYIARSNMVSIDDDHGNDEVLSIIFSLKDVNSATLIETPVRSRLCKHFACFDLETFIRLNVNTTGTRFLCPLCEVPVSLYDLHFCGLTKKLLEEFKDVVSSERNDVQFFEDGSRILMPEAKLRYANKRKAQDAKYNNGGAQKRRNAEPEIIDLIL